MQNNKPINSINHGFTVVEILVIAPIVILVIGAFIVAIVAMTGDVLASRASNKLVYDTQTALSTIEQDVKVSGAFLATNNITIQSPQGDGDGIIPFKNAKSGTNGNSLILNAYATTTNPLNSIRNLYYKPVTPGDCTIRQTSPVMINIIYFVKSNTLWRRVIMPVDYSSGCNGDNPSPPWQQPTCSIQTGSDPCITSDTKLVDNLSNNGFVINYLSSPNSSTAISTASDSGLSDYLRQNAMASATTVEIIINTSMTAAGRDITQTGTVKSTSPNNNISV